MRRRDFIKVIGGTVALWPHASCAQPTDRMHRMGFLASGLAIDRKAERFIRTALREWAYARALPQLRSAIG
jgi:hypothetical protein